jgi:hypothetical protein
MTSYTYRHAVELRDYAFVSLHSERSFHGSMAFLSQALRRSRYRPGRLGEQHTRLGVHDITAQELEEQLSGQDRQMPILIPIQWEYVFTRSYRGDYGS